jgi:riboflavin-specific deaminase-like protein
MKPFAVATAYQMALFLARSHLLASPLFNRLGHSETDSSTQPLFPLKVEGVTLKLALDTSRGVACQREIKPERFTSPESLDMVHRLRSTADAVLIGVGTALKDDPSLLVRRNVTCDRQPLRAVIDPSLKLLKANENSLHQFQLLSDGHRVVIYHCQKSAQADYAKKLPSAIYLVCLEPQTLSSNAQQKLAVDLIISDLRHRFGVRHVMIEGGPTTAQMFLTAGLVDRCIIVMAPVTFQEPILSGISVEQLSRTFARIGCRSSGVDTVEYWSKPDVPWPTTQFKDWP